LGEHSAQTQSQRSLRRLDALEKSNADLKKENAALRNRVQKLEGSSPTAAAPSEAVAAYQAPASSAVITQSAMKLTAVYMPPAADPIRGPNLYDWTGLYIGTHAGYEYGHTKGDGEFGAGILSSFGLEGWIAGGQIGYNYQ
jgi:hypothetical protein